MKSFNCKTVVDEENPHVRDKEDEYSALDDHYILILKREKEQS